MYYCVRLTGSDSGLSRIVSMSTVTTIGGLGRPNSLVLEPRPVGSGGKTLGLWQYDRKLEAAANVVALASRHLTPPTT